MSHGGAIGGAIKTCVADYGINPMFFYTVVGFTIALSIVIIFLARRLL